MQGSVIKLEGFFGKRLKLIRLERGLTLEEIAKGIQSNKSTLSLYESGKRKPEYAMIKKVSEYLGISADYMIGTVDNPFEKLNKKDTIDFHQMSGATRAYFSNQNISQEEKDDMFEDISKMYFKYKK